MVSISGGNRRRLELAAACCSPCLVRQSSATATKSVWDDLSLPERESVRTPMQWTDTPNGEFSRAEPGRDQRLWPSLAAAPPHPMGLDLEPGRGVRCEFPVLQDRTREQDPLVLRQIPRLLTEVDSARQFIPPAE
jgi:hypothetical protein